MRATPTDIEAVQALLQRTEKEPESPSRDQRVAGLKQYLSACRRDQRDTGRNKAKSTARF